MSSSITLHRKLHESAARSKGVDPESTEALASWKTGPRNLVLAIAEMYSQKAYDRRCYGNVGMGDRWLEIDGEPVSGIDISCIWDQDGPATDRVRAAKRFLEHR